MAANTLPIFVDTPNLVEVTFVNADGTTPKDLIAGATDGTRIISIAVTSDDTSAVILNFYIHDGSTAYRVGAVNVPTLSGTNGTAPAVNLLDSTELPWLDADGGFVIPTGYKIQAGPQSAVTAAKTVTIVAIGANY